MPGLTLTQQCHDRHRAWWIIHEFHAVFAQQRQAPLPSFLPHRVGQRKSFQHSAYEHSWDSLSIYHQLFQVVLFVMHKLQVYVSAVRRASFKNALISAKLCSACMQALAS